MSNYWYFFLSGFILVCVSVFFLSEVFCHFSVFNLFIIIRSMFVCLNYNIIFNFNNSWIYLLFYSLKNVLRLRMTHVAHASFFFLNLIHLFSLFITPKNSIFVFVKYFPYWRQRNYQKFGVLLLTILSVSLHFSWAVGYLSFLLIICLTHTIHT